MTTTTTTLAIDLQVGDRIAVPKDPSSGGACTYLVREISPDPDCIGRIPVRIMTEETGEQRTVWYFDTQELEVIHTDTPTEIARERRDAIARILPGGSRLPRRRIATGRTMPSA